jgi:hypothetical protein
MYRLSGNSTTKCNIPSFTFTLPHNLAGATLLVFCLWTKSMSHFMIFPVLQYFPDPVE